MTNAKPTNLLFGLMALVTILLILILAVMWKATGDTRDQTRREYELFQHDLFQQSSVSNKAMITLFRIINYPAPERDLARAVADLDVLTRAAILHLGMKIEINARILKHLPPADPLLLKDKISVTSENLMAASKWLSLLNRALKDIDGADQLAQLLSMHHDRVRHLVDILNDNLNLQSQTQGVFFSMLKHNIAGTLLRIKALLYVLVPLFLLNILLLALHLKSQKRARTALEAAHDELEQRVDHRTLEFKRVNQQLQNEIEERIISETSLRKSEARFRLLASSSPVGIFLTNVQGDGVYFNEKISEFTGRSADWHQGRGWEGAIDPADRKWVLESWRRAVSNGSDFKIEFRLGHRNGEVTWVSARAKPLRDDRGRKTGYLGTLTNITGIKTAEASLRESEQKYRSMMEAMRDGIYIVSKDWTISYMNPALMRRVGRDATGETCHEALFHLRQPCEWCVFEMVDAGKCIEIEMVHPLDGRHYLVSNSPIPHGDGSSSKLSIFHDMTHIKQMESRLHQAQKMESIGTLTGGIAHDFNNILGIIIGNTELALDDVPEWNPAHFNLEEVRTAGLRARDIVRQLLSFSRRNEQSLQPVRIVPVIKDALQLMRSIIPATIEIHAAYEADEAFVMADPTQISQVLINLCTNASQEMESTGGRLDIKVEALELGGARPQRYRDLLPGDYILFSVQDSGKGIASDIAGRIFEPYFSTKEVGQGSGIGLAVVHGIVDLHGGKIYVDSRPGQGACFTILLPQCEVVKEETALAPQELPMGDETILLVDDESALLSMTGNILRRLGYEVDATTRPEQAFERFRDQPRRYDLLVTDMTMPGMNGAGLSRKIQMLRPGLPIIICTGHSALMDEKKARDLGFAAIILKPADKQELATTIRRVLDQDPSSARSAPVETADGQRIIL